MNKERKEEIKDTVRLVAVISLFLFLGYVLVDAIQGIIEYHNEK